MRQPLRLHKCLLKICPHCGAYAEVSPWGEYFYAHPLPDTYYRCPNSDTWTSEPYRIRYSLQVGDKNATR